MVESLQAVDASLDGWSTRFVDPETGETWTRVFLGAESQGGGFPILVREPAPTAADLLSLAATSPEPSEIAASVWLLADSDSQGKYKEYLIRVAETAAASGDRDRAALLVGWGLLLDESNLRPTLGKTPDDVTSDHQHFLEIATRARKLLRLKASDPLLRDMSVFELETL